LSAAATVARRWKVTCAYEGSGFAGWQSQSNGQGIQDVIEARLAEIFKGPIRIHGSGRTDAGVHAKGQVFHFDAVWAHPAVKLKRALGIGLPAAIQIKRLATAKSDFHARFSARGKRYSYRIVEGDADPFARPFLWRIERAKSLDVAAMRAGAAVLRGAHNFSAFAADNGGEVLDPVRDLRRLDVRQTGRRLTLVFEADGFLYKMVRSLTGALVQVGEGRLAPAELAAMLASGKRTEKVPTAPAEGLFLEQVFY
jgi:tRNA pseudouridine38-40 synthase